MVKKGLDAYPKPMIEIDGMPILWHIMKEYAYYGHNEFIICAGYKQEYIKDWFANYFLHNSDVSFDFRDGKNAVVTLYATVVYTDQQTEKILYRSTEPIAVRIDTDDLNSITIPDLPSCCVSKFSTKVEVMDYSYGVLTIEGKDKNNSPFVVSLI